MNTQLFKEQALLEDSVAQLCAAEIPLTKIHEIADDSIELSDALWQQIAEQGWLGLLISEENGGIGFTWEYGLHLYLKCAKHNQYCYGDARDYEGTVALASSAPLFLEKKRGQNNRYGALRVPGGRGYVRAVVFLVPQTFNTRPDAEQVHVRRHI